MKEEQPYNNPAVSGNHLDENAIGQYAEFLCGIVPDVPADIRIHVESCAECRMEVMEAADLIRNSEQAAGKLPDKRWRSAVRTAIALVSVLILAIIIQRLTSPSTDPLISPNSKPTTPTTPITPTTPTTPITTTTTTTPTASTTPSSFTPNPTYEALLGAAWRGADNPEVKGPGNDAAFKPGDTLMITWDAGFKDNFTLLVVDNHENEVGKAAAGAAGRLEWAVNLSPGLYYWKLLGKREMWGIGRMRVEE